MGIESFNIMALPEEVNIVRDKEYWYLDGSSHLLVKNIERELDKIGAIKSGNGEWILEDCLEIKEYREEAFFQGFEVRGCLSCMQYGVNLFYEFFEVFNKSIVPLKVYIFNKEIIIEDAQQLYILIKTLYNEKISIFQKQYGDIEIKVTCSNFYNEVKKRKKWYYKLLHYKL